MKLSNTHTLANILWTPVASPIRDSSYARLGSLWLEGDGVDVIDPILAGIPIFAGTWGIAGQVTIKRSVHQ